MKFKKPFPFRIVPFAAILSVSLLFCSYKETDKNSALEDLLSKSLKIGHFNPLDMNDDFSERVFNLYMKRMDINKKFFIQSDVDELRRSYYHDIDNQMQDDSYAFYTVTNDRFNTRLKEVQSFYKDLLKDPIDFTKDEYVETDPEKMTFSKSKDDLRNEWRKYLKYQVMTRVADALKNQENAKLKSDTSVKIRSQADIEKDARDKVAKSMESYFRRLEKNTSTDRFAAYMNTVANTFDPHTEYFAPKDKADFDIALSGQLEGIGAQLQEKDGQIKVSNIVPGSASYKQGELKAGDIIVKVAQGNSEPVDITGMDLDDAVQLIRGKKGTEVRLTVKKPDGSITVIPIVRDVVVLEESYAQSSIINENGKKIGYIKLPSFYADFNGRGGRNCSDDVKKELEKLRSEGVDGIVMDLRNNGGGSLQDVVKMVGFFIDRGPVVQVKDREGSPRVLSDNASGTIYDGPLAVMINTLSASASEIFAAAIQDYHRGVIIGGNSFGKGTVQNIYDLDQFAPSNYSQFKPLGSIKITIEKFYRINGDATQLKGVEPDIMLPDPYSYLDIKEKDEEYPLPFDRIQAAGYQSFKLPDINTLRRNSELRTRSNPAFGDVIQQTAMLAKARENSKVSLNLLKYREDQKSLEAGSKQLDEDQKNLTPLNVTSLQSDLAWINAEQSRKDRINDQLKDLKKDFYLKEAADIVLEMK
jgi:carboxyl-terminal processing protease